MKEAMDGPTNFPRSPSPRAREHSQTSVNPSTSYDAMMKARCFVKKKASFSNHEVDNGRDEHVKGRGA